MAAGGAVAAKGKRLVKVIDLGMQCYRSSIKVMNQILRNKVDSLKSQPNHPLPDYLLFCENQPVYTVGLRRKSYDVSADLERLRALGASLELTNRGGLITFHGPGQIVMYPILNLKYYVPGIRSFVDQLEEVAIETCKEFGVEASRTADAGVWIEERKLAAIGLNVQRYITSHGLSLNCNVDLSWFKHISACGLDDKEATSISKETGTNATVSDVKPILIAKMADVFAMTLEDCKLDELTFLS